MTAGTLLADSALAAGEQPAIFTGILSSVLEGSGGNAGTVIVRADNVILNRAQIDSSTFSDSSGNAGTVIVHADNLTLKEAQISVATRGSGKAGDIRIAANQMSLDNFAWIIASSLRDAAGAGGEITVHAGNLVIRDQSQIASLTRGRAPAGNINVIAGTLLVDSALAPGEQPRNNLVTGINASARSSDGQSTNLGRAGNISIRAGEIRLTNEALIRSDTEGPGDAGNINITVPGALTVENGSAITNSTYAQGNAGTVIIRADNLTLKDGRISVATFGSGKAGDIRIAANQMTLDTKSEIFASSLRDAAGAGGEITVHAGNLVIRDQWQITTITRGRAPAGNINVTAGTLVIDAALAAGEQPRNNNLTGIFSNAASGSSGNAGTVMIKASDLALGSDARIDTSTFGSGNGGTVTIEADNLTLTNAIISSGSFGSGAAGTIILTGVSKLFISDGAEVTTRSGSAGGGNIEISGAGLIVLRDSSHISADVVEGGAPAGDIAIDSRFLVLDHSKISATNAAGSGGKVVIASDFIIRSPDSEITSRTGPAVLLNPETDVTGDLAPLPGDVVMNTADQMQDRCAVRGLVEGSSFTIAGPEALSPTLEGYLPGTYAAVADEDAAVTDGSLMVASGGLAFPVWTVACGDAG